MTTKYAEVGGDTCFDGKFIETAADRLVVGTRLPFNVFIVKDGDLKHIFNRGMIFAQYALNILNEKKIAEIYIPGDERPDLEAYLDKGPLQKIIREEDPEFFKAYSIKKEEYHQIDRNILRPGTEINFSLYLSDELTFTILVETTGDKFFRIDKALLPLHGDILIKKADLHLFNEYLQSVIQQGEKRPDGNTSRVRALMIRENSKMIMEELLEDPRSGETIKKTNTVVNTIVDTILANKDTVYDLIDMSKYDYYTYTHSVNVAVMSIGLGSALGLDRTHIEELGMGAMLHDIGKSSVPPEILNKQGKLDSIEFQVIKGHVVEGEKILRMHRDFPEEAFPAVLQHHEKLTGRGYPFGISGRELTLFGRITSIVDCYDALTTKRPYKRAYRPFDALSILIREKEDYDCQIVKDFIEMIGKVGKQ